jgi:hypothetical protein
VVTLTPKTDKGARTISLDARTVAVLRAHRVAQMEERLACGSAYQDEGDYVFRREDGVPIHRRCSSNAADVGAQLIFGAM